MYLLTRGVPHLKLNLQFSLREGQRSRLQMFSYGVSLEVRIVERGGGRIKGRYALLSTCTGRCIFLTRCPLSIERFELRAAFH